ncbi:hypothetical protein SDC9_188188 [bioreactor metagenome]|uniref:Uncharacterized protein n=1 Tax=bioreactor metagenome TaxID=1076179 RepID=A0A645HP79_9ZZZZ
MINLDDLHIGKSIADAHETVFCSQQIVLVVLFQPGPGIRGQFDAQLFGFNT